jgi:hypothetical protein
LTTTHHVDEYYFNARMTIAEKIMEVMDRKRLVSDLGTGVFNDVMKEYFKIDYGDIKIEEMEEAI